MAFTGTIKTITTDGETILIGVVFQDSATGWSTDKMLSFQESITQSQAVAAITTAGQAYKNKLTLNQTLQAKVGTIITI